MRDCACLELCLLCAGDGEAFVKRLDQDALWWSQFTDAPPGTIHLAVSEALRVDPRIPEEAREACRAKSDVLGQVWTSEEFVEALDSIRRNWKSAKA